MEKTLKLFVSVPTLGRIDSEVDAEKAAILDRIRAAYDETVELIDSYVSEDAPVSGDCAGAWYLGESIKRLATADVACFADDFEKARGCQIEWLVCERYNIPNFSISEISAILRNPPDYADALKQSAKEHPGERLPLWGCPDLSKLSQEQKAALDWRGGDA